MNLLLELKNVNLSLGGARVLSHINWQVHAQESWAVLGANGSGKTSLLRLALGELRPDQRLNASINSSTGTGGGEKRPSPPPADPAGPYELAWYIAGEKETSPIAAKQVTASVSPELHTWYQKHGGLLRGEELLLSGLYASPLLYISPMPEDLAEVYALAEQLELAHLLDCSIAEMSYGQLRRMLIARALIRRPLLLALDEVFEGLDQAAHIQLMDLLERLSAFESSILLTAHRTGDLPEFIRNVLILEEGRIIQQGRLENMQGSEQDSRSRQRSPNLIEAALPPPQTASPATALQHMNSPCPCPPLLELKKVNIYLQGRHILHDLDWRVGEGENWAILGGNGSGKTTLLRCLWGDEHPALGGQLSWFGQPGPHNQQHLHQKFGLVSHQLQASIPPGLLVKDLVVSGFFSSIELYHSPSAAQEQTALNLLEKTGLAALAERRAGTLSYGQLRRALLARALVHDPILLLLDEPCSGLDPASRNAFLHSLAASVRSRKTQLIHVTHCTEDLPEITTHVLYLEQGRITYQGPYPRPEL